MASGRSALVRIDGNSSVSRTKGLLILVRAAVTAGCAADPARTVARLRTDNPRVQVATNRENLAAAIQNFRQTSEHLKALSKEVRRSPWRRFAKPDKEAEKALLEEFDRIQKK